MRHYDDFVDTTPAYTPEQAANVRKAIAAYTIFLSAMSAVFVLGLFALMRTSA